MDSDERNLVEYVRRSLDGEEEFHFLRFEFLQRLNIVQIQLDLIRMKSRINRDGAISSSDKLFLTTRLRDYATAIRDYQELRNKRGLAKPEARKRKLLLQRFFQSPGNDFNDPFQSHYSYFEEPDGKIDPLRQTFMRHLPSWLTFSHQEKIERSKEYSEGMQPKEVLAFVDRLARFLIAVTGGGFLIVPMVVMTLGQSQTKSLVTVSVAVVLFALVLAFGIRVSNVETLVATATYAAVLVVFVGTSAAGTSPVAGSTS
ncbi:hypothetical protein EDB81DRAFT_351874 [Dactylonectria macrodidyma]|uniref:DUF6594 domain-containing protein n=1 Tax=Dactylonectria macrodidyma TaxID=307937 RepID=A0A9P9FG92_9HYPO|nr:hypothetical protein EDB81DRAFT_351874 [Dactylonectria macrodidyma]